MAKKEAAEAVLFVLDEADTFEWTVRVPVPVDGKYVRAEFTAVFANLVGDDLDDLTAKLPNGAEKHTDLQIAQRVLVGWGTDLKAAKGEALAFTPENKARLLANQRVRLAVVGTFLAAARGVAAEKN